MLRALLAWLPLLQPRPFSIAALYAAALPSPICVSYNTKPFVTFIVAIFRHDAIDFRPRRRRAVLYVIYATPLDGIYGRRVDIYAHCFEIIDALDA